MLISMFSTMSETVDRANNNHNVNKGYTITMLLPEIGRRPCAYGTRGRGLEAINRRQLLGGILMLV